MLTLNFDLFAAGGLSAKSKLLSLGAPDTGLAAQVCSLNLEHVSPAGQMRSEISRHRDAAVADAAILASMRRWFFARKPDAGFVLADFPATLLQAQVFDEWLEARDENLTGVLLGAAAPAAVAEHYRTLGLVIERTEPAATWA